MNLTGRPISIAYAILLAGCAWLAWRQMLGLGFAMGETAGGIGLSGDAFLIVTAIRIAGLALASLGSWTRWPFFSLIATLSLIGVLPMASIYFKQSLDVPIWHYNSDLTGACFAWVLDPMALLFPDRDTEPDWRPSDGLDLFQAIARCPHLALQFPVGRGIRNSRICFGHRRNMAVLAPLPAPRAQEPAVHSPFARLNPRKSAAKNKNSRDRSRLFVVLNSFAKPHWATKNLRLGSRQSLQPCIQPALVGGCCVVMQNALLHALVQR